MIDASIRVAENRDTTEQAMKRLPLLLVYLKTYQNVISRATHASGWA
jgi:hypothetical protein